MVEYLSYISVEKEKRKTKNDVTGLDDEIRLQQVEGESWRHWTHEPAGRQRTKKKKKIIQI